MTTTTSPAPNAPAAVRGPGNPFARQVAALRQTVVSFLTPERLERVLQAVLEKA